VAPGQEVNRLEDFWLVYVVLNSAEELLYWFENVKKREGAFDWLVEIQIWLTVIDHISKKFNQGLAASSQRGFYQLFIVGGTQTIEEAQYTLHKFLSVVREGG